MKSVFYKPLLHALYCIRNSVAVHEVHELSWDFDAA